MRSPAFATAVIFVLALGIGANTAIFSAVNALLLNPFPFPQSDRVVAVQARHVSGRNRGAGYRDFLDWRAQNVVFEEMAIPGWTAAYTLTGRGEPERMFGTLTTAGFMRVLGVQPVLGRFFTAEEDRPGAPLVAVLSYAAWQRRSGGSPDILGQVLTLNGKPFTVVGIMPRNFVFPGMRSCDFWCPLREDPANERHQHQYQAIARLKPKITLERARTDMTAIACRLEQQYPSTNTGWGVAVVPIGEAIAADTARPLAVLVATVGLVLLLACANVAGLMLARSSGRVKEMAMRAALGASRQRIARQLLTETLLLALSGGALGLTFARWFISLLRIAAPADLGLDSALRIDSKVLGFTLAVSLLTGIISGLAPALFGSKADLNSALKSATGSGSGASPRGRFLSSLVVGEVALTVILLAGAGLLMKDLLVILRLDTGMQVDHVLTFTLDLPRTKYSGGQRLTEFYSGLLGILRSMPGVEGASLVDTLPMTGQYSGGKFEIEGRPKPLDWTDMATQFNSCMPGYFSTMGIPLQRGRDFDERDSAEASPAAIVNDTFARRFFAAEDPVGHRIRIGRWWTIVGVVGSVKHQRPMNAPVPMVYFSCSQAPAPGMWVTIRTKEDPHESAAAARSAVHTLDRDVAVLRLRTMHQVVSDSLIEARMIASCVAGFAGFALLLSAIGMYGVIASLVSRRTHEIGVRLALGASRRDVLALVLGKSALLAGTGAVIGIPAALAGSRILGSMLYGISPQDTTVFISVPLVLVLVALAAGYVPARRAARVDPVIALRQE